MVSIFKYGGWITAKFAFLLIFNAMSGERLIKWNSSNHSYIILKIDGSCLDLPVRAGYGGVIRNSVGYYFWVF